MPSVEKMIDTILEHEGGYVNHPNDPGGATNFGITQKTLSSYFGHYATVDDVKNLHIDIAREIYQKDYYFAPRIDWLPDTIQAFIFDCAVNHGTKRAIKFVQRVCNQAGITPALSEDGVMGPNTKSSADRAEKEMNGKFYPALIEERKNFCLSIAESRPSLNVFLNGWLNRIAYFESEIEQNELV